MCLWLKLCALLVMLLFISREYFGKNVSGNRGRIWHEGIYYAAPYHTLQFSYNENCNYYSSLYIRRVRYSIVTTLTRLLAAWSVVRFKQGQNILCSQNVPIGSETIKPPVCRYVTSFSPKKETAETWSYKSPSSERLSMTGAMPLL